MKLISWNVNGIRAALKKGFLDFLLAESPDILCVQETKAQPEDVTVAWPGYEAHWNWAEKKGYSGVLTLTKQTPLSVVRGIGVDEHDKEGRVLVTEFADFYLVNVYVPNSQRELGRLPYRQLWDRAFLSYLKTLEQKKPVIFCGDLNVAHTEIDLARPKGNEKNHGFTPEERAGFSMLVESGFIDTFREFEKGGGHYTWWSQMAGARQRNVGWRIDYFLCSGGLRARLKNARIYPHVLGSDHCPVGVEFFPSEKPTHPGGDVIEAMQSPESKGAKVASAPPPKAAKPAPAKPAAAKPSPTKAAPKTPPPQKPAKAQPPKSKPVATKSKPKPVKKR